MTQLVVLRGSWSIPFVRPAEERASVQEQNVIAPIHQVSLMVSLFTLANRFAQVDQVFLGAQYRTEVLHTTLQVA
jgi:hypothetical protein